MQPGDLVRYRGGSRRICVVLAVEGIYYKVLTSTGSIEYSVRRNLTVVNESR